MITYPVSQSTKFVVYRISTQEIIKRNAPWPNGNGDPLAPGSYDPDYVYLEMKKGSVPNYDPRYFVLITTETPDIPNEEWNITYSTQKREALEIGVAIDNIEASKRESILPQEQINFYLLLAVATLFRRIDGLQLTQKEIALKDMIISKAIKVWNNRDRLDLIKSQIQSGQEPDLDEGWSE